MSTITDHITIANLNRPITIQKFVFAQDDSGGNIKILVSSYNLMADVQPISNNYVLDSLQIKYGEGYRITVRYEPSRHLTPNDEILYKGRVHKIQSIRNQDEAGKRFVIINTSSSNSDANDSTGVIIPIREYHWIAAGGEYTVSADAVKNWQGTIVLFRGKVQFRVIRTGTPSPVQALYDEDAGTFTFSTDIIPLLNGEAIDAYLLSDPAFIVADADPQIKEFHYTATGGEYTISGPDDIKNWTGPILLFRGKLEYKVIGFGTPSPNEVLYDGAAGTFTFNNSILSLMDGETVDVYLLPEAVSEYSYTATGGESIIASDSLKGWQDMIVFFRGKTQFRVIRAGLPSPVQVLYDPASGSFRFNDAVIPLTNNESINIFLINT